MQVFIESLSHDGRGVGRVEGKTVFVEGALPGERVTLGRVRRRRQYDEAELASVDEASPDRVVPKCEHFGICGGCSLQHLRSEAQLAFKERQLLDQLDRIGRVKPGRILPPIAGEAWNYRRRARLGVKYVPKKGRVLVGFRERAAPFLADLKRCEILSAPVDGLIEPLARMIGELSLRSRLPQIEVAVADNATALVFRVLDAPTPQDLERFAQFGAEYKVRVYLQPGGPETIAPLVDTPAEPLFYRLPEFDLTLQFAPTDFIQVNALVNRRLVQRAVELLDPGPDERVVDLFCGLGNFTLPLARRAGSVVGVEGDAALVQRARSNARLNGLEQVRFHAANLFAEDLNAPGGLLPWMRESFDRVLVDPPRAGAREILPWIARCGARRVVYISCHPGSLARDAGILVHELGFSLVAAGAIDMFTHTAHVESMAVFERNGA